MTDPLSPQARAVLDAVLAHWEANPVDDEQYAIAVALRAAALYCKQDRLILLSLADELEAHGQA